MKVTIQFKRKEDYDKFVNSFCKVAVADQQSDVKWDGIMNVLTINHIRD